MRTFDVVHGDDELAEFATVANAVWPNDPSSVTELRDVEASMRDSLWLLAREDGAAVGSALAAITRDGDSTSRICVLTHARRSGIGTELLTRASTWARDRSLGALRTWVPYEDPDGLPWAQRRGFREIGRELTLALKLRGLRALDPALPDGVELTTLAERPELLRDVWEIANETWPDVPGNEDLKPIAFDDFVRTFTEVATYVPEAAFVALERDRALAYAKVTPRPGVPGAAYNAYTGVRREARGRGIGRALKLAQIRWAKDAGYELLLTHNDELNAPIRRLNESLGYVPHSGRIRLERALG